MIKRWTSRLKALQWLMMSRSFDRSRFEVPLDYLNMFKMNACIYCNHSLVLYSILNECSLITIHQIRHSSSERETGFAPISYQISMPWAEWAAASTKASRLPVGNMAKEKKIKIDCKNNSQKKSNVNRELTFKEIWPDFFFVSFLNSSYPAPFFLLISYYQIKWYFEPALDYTMN
jgi:hypothetical protein